MTIGGIEALGAEVNLPPALVREAARSLTRLGPAPRELVGDTQTRFRRSPTVRGSWMDPTTPPDERWGFTDVVGVIFLSTVVTAGILPMVFLGIARSRRRRLRRFFKHGTPALCGDHRFPS